MQRPNVALKKIFPLVAGYSDKATNNLGMKLVESDKLPQLKSPLNGIVPSFKKVSLKYADNVCFYILNITIMLNFKLKIF